MKRTTDKSFFWINNTGSGLATSRNLSGDNPIFNDKPVKILAIEEINGVTYYELEYVFKLPVCAMSKLMREKKQAKNILATLGVSVSEEEERNYIINTVNKTTSIEKELKDKEVIDWKFKLYENVHRIETDELEGIVTARRIYNDELGSRYEYLVSTGFEQEYWVEERLLK